MLSVKKAYSAPALVVYGRVHDLTLGSSGAKLDFLGQRFDEAINIIGVDSNNPGATCPGTGVGCVIHFVGS
jgi:hypothetical protein